LDPVFKKIDLSIRAGGLNIGRVYLGSDKIHGGVFWFYGFRVNPTGLERLFSEFFFGQNQNLGIFIT